MEPPVRRSVLVVDDEEVVRSLCFRVLTPLGYDVQLAANGDAALELLKAQTFDTVITDYRMPGSLNGLQLGKAIKQLHPLTQIIFMTAFPEVDATVDMMRMGALDCLIKPFAAEQLVARLEDTKPKPSRDS